MNRRSRLGFTLTLGALFLSVAAGAFSAQRQCEWDRVDLRGDWGIATFNVEVADTPESRSVGLMNRVSLDRNHGMLFIFDAPVTASFWMKNTLIPLDILFFDARGILVHKKDRATPLSTESILGGDHILAVLEINGGLAELYGIGLGTEIRHPGISHQESAWNCPANPL